MRAKELAKAMGVTLQTAHRRCRKAGVVGVKRKGERGGYYIDYDINADELMHKISDREMGAQVMEMLQEVDRIGRRLSALNPHIKLTYALANVPAAIAA